MIRPKRFRAGQQYKKYSIHRKIATTDARGKTTYSVSAEPVGTLYGAVSSYSPSEREQWGQLGHEVTHRIVVEGKCEAQENDVLVRDGRKFYVETKKDNGALGMFTVLACRELNGVDEIGNISI